MLDIPVFSNALIALEGGDIKNGKSLVREVISKYTDSKHAGYAVEIYLEYELFDDAIEVYIDYENRTGVSLQCDYSLEEVKALKKTNFQVKKDGKKLVFEYMSIRERGFLSGMRRLFPIKTIKMDDSSITFHSRLAIESFSWKRLKKLTIVKQKTQISIGNPYWQNLLVFDFGEKKKVIDVTKGLPDYKGNTVLIQFLKNRFDIEEVNNKRVRIFNWPGAFLVAGCVAMGAYIVLKDFGYL